MITAISLSRILQPFHLQDEFIEKIKQSIPALPEERIKKYIAELHLSEYDAVVLTEEKAFANYFEKLISSLPSPLSGEGKGVRKAAANWMLGPVKSWLNENSKEINEFPLPPQQVAALISLIDSGKVSFSAASTKIFERLLIEPLKNPEQIATDLNLIQQSDVSAIGPIVDQVLLKFADKVVEYKKREERVTVFVCGGSNETIER